MLQCVSVFESNMIDCSRNWCKTLLLQSASVFESKMIDCSRIWCKTLLLVFHQEYTKGVIRILKSRNRQHNDQNKRDKTIYNTLHR